MFVEDESVAFGALRCLVAGSPEEIGVDYIDVASFVERLSDFVDQILARTLRVNPLTLQHTLP